MEVLLKAIWTISMGIHMVSLYKCNKVKTLKAASIIWCAVAFVLTWI